MTSEKKFSIIAHVAIVKDGKTLLDCHTTRRSAPNAADVLKTELKRYNVMTSDGKTRGVSRQSAITLTWRHPRADDVTMHLSILQDGACKRCAAVGEHAAYCDEKHAAASLVIDDIGAMFGLTAEDDAADGATTEDGAPVETTEGDAKPADGAPVETSDGATVTLEKKPAEGAPKPAEGAKPSANGAKPADQRQKTRN